MPSAGARRTPGRRRPLGEPSGHQRAAHARAVDDSMREPKMIEAFLPVLRSSGYGGQWMPVEALAGARPSRA